MIHRSLKGRVEAIIAPAVYLLECWNLILEKSKRKGKLGKSHFYRIMFLLRPALCASNVCEEQYCLKLVGFQLRSVYCTSYMWMTVNSPLTYKIPRWSPNSFVIQSFGPLLPLSPHSFPAASLSLHGWAVAWPNRLVGEGEFPGQILQVITFWIIESWLSFSITTV